MYECRLFDDVRTLQLFMNNMHIKRDDIISISHGADGIILLVFWYEKEKT